VATWGPLFRRFFRDDAEVARSSTSSVFFFRALGAFFEDDRGRTPDRVPSVRQNLRVPWLFAAATLVQAGAHGALASCAGLLGQALVGRQFVAAGAFVDSPPLLFPPLLLCLCGFTAALVKTGAGALGIYEQKRAASA